MVVSRSPVDYYAVLQVHPDADHEVIDAAYRQLMKKYHPDMAGDDPRAGIQNNERAKAINAAYGVLRDPERRREYDRLRIVVGTRPPPADYRRASPTPDAPPPANQPSPDRPPPASTPTLEDVEPTGVGGPIGLLVALYYLLPGPYEWERRRNQEALIGLLLPALGVSGFLLATGRFTPVIGDSYVTKILAWGFLVLLSLPLWHSLPRVAMACLPSLLMLHRDAAGFATAAHVPIWLAWVMLGVVSLALSGRLYVFSVLPTLGICWLLSRFT